MRSLAAWILTVVLLPLPALAQGAGSKDSITSAVASLMAAYPAATLLDIYKSAFQNRFGPGHIIADADRAKEYLEKEMQMPALRENAPYEPTLYDGSYYRVNLSVIADGTVPEETFMEAFLRSASAVEPPSMDAWRAEWKEILAAVESMQVELPGYEEDKEAIQRRLDAGIFAGEHSEVFVKAYDPHYRIIEKKIFEIQLKPLIDKKFDP